MRRWKKAAPRERRRAFWGVWAWADPTLPGNFGRGSSTLAKWIQANLDKDAAGKPAKGKGAWKSLFTPDTKTLDGWQVKSGFATYVIKHGAILGTTAEGSGNTFLCTEKHYADFELEFELASHAKLNSGVQIRSQLRNPEGKYGGRVNGPQVEIEASGTKGAEAGYIYGEATGRGWLTPKDELKPHKHFKDREWNKYRIVAKGPRIQTWINGQLSSDIKHAAHKRGTIGLQHNAKQGVYRFRNIRIRELTAK